MDGFTESWLEFFGHFYLIPNPSRYCVSSHFCPNSNRTLCFFETITIDPISNSVQSTADKKCPFTGQVSIRGRILTGTVVSTKMHRTIIIRREYLHYIPKYSRYEKRHKNIAAHVSPAFRVEEGDQVTVGQCRPLSKTVCVGLKHITLCYSRDILAGLQFSFFSAHNFGYCIVLGHGNVYANQCLSRSDSMSSASFPVLVRP